MTSGAPTGENGGRIPLHRRVIEFEAYDDGPTISIMGRLRDSRPWADGTDKVAELHDMDLTVSVDKETRTIVAADAAMRRFPHAECPAITSAFAGLVGDTVGRGYTRRVQERFDGAAGCTHLAQLARTLGPVVVQALTSDRSARGWADAADGEATESGSGTDRTPAGANGTPDAVDARRSLFPPNTCHIWAEGGVGEQKLATGWRPGVTGYPAPPVAVVVELMRKPSS